MKKILTAAILTSLTMSTAAFAQGGFKGPSALSATTVQDAKEMRDDTNVILVGHITKYLGGENYQFEDATGTITVEIDEDLWRNLTVTPQDKVELRGEVDKGWTKLEIDVDSIQIVQ